MRMQQQFDSDTGTLSPSRGYIAYDESPAGYSGGPGQAIFEVSLGMYLDALGLKPRILRIPPGTNLHSYPISVDLSGPVILLPDDRMEIQLKNTRTVDIDVIVGGISNVDRKIYPNALSLNVVSKVTKQ